MPLLSPMFGPPPFPRRSLGLAVVENGYPVSVLQIVCGCDPVLGVTAVSLPPSGKPCAARAAPSIPERKSLFEAPPIGFGADRKSKATRPGFEVCVANGARHSPPSSVWGLFGEYL